MSEGKIKLPRSSYEEICKIIIAYGQFDKKTSLVQLSKTIAMGQSQISANNSFLTTIEVIEGGQKKFATSKGRAIARALQHNIVDEIRNAWREIIQQNEFLNKMILSIKIRKGMDISAFESHIAYSAGEAKSKPVMTGARSVIDILKAANLIEEQDGKIFPIGDDSIITTTTPTTTTSTTTIASTTTPAPGLNKLYRNNIAHYQDLQSSVPPGIAIINLNINVTIDAKPSDVETLGVKINNLLKELSQPTINEDKNSHKE